MLHSLPDFVRNYWMFLAGAAVFCIVLSYVSAKFFSYLKKGLLAFAMLFALAAGYELLTGKSLFSLPGSIEDELSKEPSHVETGRRYYRSYEERFGEKPPK